MAQIKIQSGIIMTGIGKAQIEHTLAIPSPDPGQVLIKVRAIALNSPDWIALDYFGRPGAGMGFDFAGEVVEIGANCETWKIGNRVAGFVHACHAANYANGSFREYLLADADLLMRLPEHLSFAEASTLGMGISTAAQALYQWLPLPLPACDAKPSNETVLIYGGSTATGSIAIQLAKFSGLRVITTCSQQHISWLRSLGADEVIDYRNPSATETIRSLVQKDGLYSILDCIASAETATFCYKCFSVPQRASEKPPSLIYAGLMIPPEEPRHPDSIPPSVEIHSVWNIVYTCFGRRFTMIKEEIGLKRTWEASACDKHFMVAFYRRVDELLEKKKLRPMPIETRQGGLAGALEGVSKVRQGTVRGKKLVYEL